jgi:hypothetical protein
VAPGPVRALLFVALSGAVFWGLSGSSGTPRLVVDRTEADLGYRSFGVPAQVVFTLTNAGDGPLRLKDVPRVIVKAGC